MVDLFALGVILFFIYSGHPPFKNAIDFLYGWIGNNREDLFWKYHSENKAPGFYSDSFKALITKMLKCLPDQRLSMADIIGHPWLQGEIASAEDIKKEFAKRKADIDKKKLDDLNEK